LAKLFRENGIDHKRVNYFNEPFTAKTLSALIRKTELEPYALLRMRDQLIDKLGITAETKDTDVIGHMVENPSLLQRPIVEIGDEAVLARPIEKAIELIRKLYEFY